MPSAMPRRPHRWASVNSSCARASSNKVIVLAWLTWPNASMSDQRKATSATNAPTELPSVVLPAAGEREASGSPEASHISPDHIAHLPSSHGKGGQVELRGSADLLQRSLRPRQPRLVGRLPLGDLLLRGVLRIARAQHVDGDAAEDRVEVVPQGQPRQRVPA